MKWLASFLLGLVLSNAAQAQTDSFLALNGTFKNPFNLINTWSAAQTFNGATTFTGTATFNGIVGGALPSSFASGLPLADARSFASLGSCTGSTDASAAIAAAISAGFFRILLPAGCLYQPPSSSGNEIVPNGIQIVGQNADPNLGNVSLVRTANRATGTDFLGLGARSSLQNVAVQSNFCDQQTIPLATQKLCPVGYTNNVGDQNQVVSNWPYENFVLMNGATTTQPGVAAANDTPLFAVLQNNVGDGIYSATSNAGVSHRIVTTGTSGDQGILIQNSFLNPANVHTGLHCVETGTNVSSSCSSLERANGATSVFEKFFDDGPGTATTDWQQWIVGFQSAGNIRSSFQTTTPFSGTFDYINAGNSGGTFTGNFVNYTIANATRFQVNSAGTVTAAGVLNSGVNGGTGGSLTLNGATSGSLIQNVPAAAGTPTVTWGSGSGTPAVTASAPLAIAAATGAISITSPLPVANGGTGDTGTAWTTYTPAFTCGTATFTVNSTRSKTLGKTTWIQGDATITAIGTCVSTLTFTLPNTANSSGVMAGREYQNTNNLIGCDVTAASATGTCLKYGGGAWAVNDKFRFSGVYENQ